MRVGTEVDSKILEENWVDIPGYNGLYQISNYGRVKSVGRAVRNSPDGAKRWIPTRLMSPWDNGNGYLVVGLNKGGGKRKNHYVHRLVADAFLKKEGDVVNHIDYDKKNNCVLNLEWCTQQQNVNHSREHRKGERKKSKPTNTGEKYICAYSRRGRMCYRLNIRRLGVCKQYQTLYEAVNERDKIILGNG